MVPNEQLMIQKPILATSDILANITPQAYLREGVVSHRNAIPRAILSSRIFTNPLGIEHTILCRVYITLATETDLPALLSGFMLEQRRWRTC